MYSLESLSTRERPKAVDTDITSNSLTHVSLFGNSPGNKQNVPFLSSGRPPTPSHPSSILLCAVCKSHCLSTSVALCKSALQCLNPSLSQSFSAKVAARKGCRLFLNPQSLSSSITVSGSQIAKVSAVYKKEHRANVCKHDLRAAFCNLIIFLNLDKLVNEVLLLKS